MAIVRIEGKNVTISDDLVRISDRAERVRAVKAVLAVNGFPAIENAVIEFEDDPKGGPPIVHVEKRSTGKGAPSPYDEFFAALFDAREYVNPAIALAAQVERAEQDGDTEFFQRVVQSGELERAVMEGAREGKSVWQALAALGHATPCSSKTVPVGF